MRLATPFLISIAVFSAAGAGLRPVRAADTPTQTLLETARAAGTFKSLLKALGETDLAKTLEGKGPYTVFAPTDEAFRKLPGDEFEALLKDPKKLRALLGHHVVAGMHLAKELAGMTTAKPLDGADLTIDATDGLKIEGANVTKSDVEAINGVIHVIDTVLMPPKDADPTMKESPDSFYALSTTTLEGKAASLSAYKGKVTLVVNVASECGYTPQYAALQTLHAELEAKGFSVLGFPSNEFGGQEPGDAGEIRTFCDSKYGVKFPLFEKLVTKPGDNQSPIYAFLTKGREAPNWNFCKYLVGKDGKVIAFYPSKVKPTDDDLRKAIEAALTK